MEEKKRIPFLLGVSLYGLLVLLILMIIGLILVLVNVNQFTFLNENFSVQNSEYGSLTLIYLPFLFILCSIYSVLQMIRRKRHAHYLFILLSVILIGVLFWQKPIDILNILFVFLINVIVFIHPSWFQQSTLETNSKVSPEIAKNESKIEE